jgi:metal-responsive CopG/Arc/MetJ family transcriptional regulator
MAMARPRSPEGPATQVTVRIPDKVLDRLDDVRGRLNRQQWIRKVILDRLDWEEGNYRPVRAAAQQEN